MSNLDSCTLNLDSVILPTYEHPLWNKFPLYSHQYKALELKEPFVMNVPTGFGKTYAGIIPSITEERHKTFFVFPSNALVETQYNSVKSRLKKWKIDFDSIKLTGDGLLEYMLKERYNTKGGALCDLITQHEKNVIFTNIDIMFNIISLRYARKFARDVISSLKSSRIIIDEFHFYKNITAILLGALYQRLLKNTKDVSFLSATPCKNTLDLLDVISPLYKNFITTEEKINKNSTSTRKVIFPTTLTIAIPPEDIVKVAYEWLIKKYDERNIGMCILDSVKDSIVLYKKLKDNGINSYLYTGLLKDPVPEKLRRGIIIGTSAIEVGIDKDIDFLFFEARNATSFLQRFGRVGRHSGGEAYGVIHPELFRQLSIFPQGRKLPRLQVLKSLVQNEYRFNYLKLFFTSEFSDIITTLKKIYDPDVRLTEKEKQTLRNLNVRDGISIFVIGKRGDEEALTFYDVLRIVRDYRIKKCYFGSEANERIRDLDELSQLKFNYYSKFYLPLIAEIDDFYEHNQSKLRIRFEEPKFFRPSIPIIKLAFEPLIQQKLFRQTINNRQIIEEGCITMNDYSDRQKVWVWGYSSKLVEDVSTPNII